MTPSEMIPATRKAAPSSRKTIKSRKTTRRGQDADRSARPGAGKQGEPALGETTAKPRRFVPAEFDNDDSNPGSPRPYMSPSGRPGVGMRF